MEDLVRYPFFILAVTFPLMWLSTKLGVLFRRKQPEVAQDARDDLNLIVAGTLTLLGLIIAFSFSMATSRYDQRKNYEEIEANSIATEYARAGLLPGVDAARVRMLLSDYLDQRILFYRSRDEQELRRIDECTRQLQNELWSAVETLAEKRDESEPAPFLALVISGMNDVLNSQGHTQAAWWNRIPGGAWWLMIIVAVFSNVLVGYGVRRGEARGLLFVLPILLCIAFFLIADIDAPRHGVIRVHPHSLASLAQSLHARGKAEARDTRNDPSR